MNAPLALSSPPWTRPTIASFASLLFHLLFFGLLMIQATSKGERRPDPKHLIVIALTPYTEQGVARAQQTQTVAPTPPPAQPQPPKPAEALPQPHPVTPAPSKPVRPTAPPKVVAPPVPAAPPKPVSPPVTAPPNVQKEGDQGDSAMSAMLNRVRDNWLRPRTSATTFRCRFRVDYLPGGIISNVMMMEGCGSDELNASVQTAVWKTQPLPLAPGKSGSGSVTLDFSP